jgi:hypothetical protein
MSSAVKTLLFSELVKRLNECNHTLLNNLTVTNEPTERSINHNGTDAIVFAGFSNTIVIDNGPMDPVISCSNNNSKPMW